MLAAILTVTFGFLTLPAYADSISDNPIVFVTMVPNPADFGTTAATFGNHLGGPNVAQRGGDLWIRYPDGTLKNLTSAAGYGTSGFQGANAIAVRDPAVHWDGNKVVFSMIVGNPTQRYQLTDHKWQLYEVTGLSPSATPIIQKVANQPAAYNNIAPAYASDDSIIFVSDRPRDDSVLHTYPQRDEYESSPVNSGLWNLNPTSGSLKLLDHSPSGDFNPIVDSFGRVIFTRWDHLQRDQQNVGGSFGAFNFLSETSATATNNASEVFPEPRSVNDPNYKSTINLFTLNQFFPWMMNQDGSDMETLNHLGRQEIGLYSERSFNNDPNVQEFYGQYTTGQNQNDFTIFLHIKESPTQPGLYFGTNCQEFGTHSAGQLLTINGAPHINPDNMLVTYLTHPSTAGATDTPSSDHSGLYRDPLPLSNGKVIASHTANTRQDSNIGTGAAPQSRYDFRIKLLTQSGSYFTPSTNLTPGISKSISFWNPDTSVSYNGPLWELMPVELKARSRPASPSATLPTIEANVLTNMGVSEEELRSYLRAQNLALVVSRDVTMRDRNDRQQPTNLRVHGTNTQSVPRSGKVYDISHLQFFQGDLIRGYNGHGPGRRVLAQPMSSVASGVNPLLEGAPAGAVAIAEDGSTAALVPALRALSWEMVDPAGEAVVRERYWLTFQPGEIRVCTSCHGINTADHLGRPAPTNPPLALSQLLAHWKNLPMPTPTPVAGGPFRLSLSAKPGPMAGATLKLSAHGGLVGVRYKITSKIGRTPCPGATSFTKSSSVHRLTGKLPSIGRQRIEFSLSANGVSTRLASKSLTVRRGSGRGGTSTARGCKALMKSLKAAR